MGERSRVGKGEGARARSTCPGAGAPMPLGTGPLDRYEISLGLLLGVRGAPRHTGVNNLPKVVT